MQGSILPKARPLGLRPLFVVVSALCLLLAACGGSGSGSSSTTSSSSGPVNLTFWSWVPGISASVNEFNQTHPNIHVTLNEVPTGSAGTYAKMFAAIKANNAPDVGQIEYNVLPNFEATGGLRDISSYGANAVANDFVSWTWNQVKQGNAVYAIPQDTGPMALFYNKSVFDKYHLTVPTTWAQYAQDAATLHNANPNLYITDFPPRDPQWFIGMAWENGARWFKINGNSWQVSINDSPTQQVATYWQKLLSNKEVKTEPDFSSGWYSDLQNGTVATWIGAAWSTAILQDQAPKASGQWRVAQMPQWQAGQNSDGDWGGSTTAVFKDSKHPKEAAEFAIWLNTSLKSWPSLITKGGLYPALKSATSLPQLSGSNAYFGNQKVFNTFQQESSAVDPNFAWGPTMTQVVSDGSDDFAKVTAGKTTLTNALDTLQSSTVQQMKQQGFSVQG